MSNCQLYFLVQKILPNGLFLYLYRLAAKCWPNFLSAHVFCLLLILCFLPVGCSPNTSKIALVLDAADSFGFKPRIFQSDFFPIFALLKRGSGDYLHVYLEGDGQAYLNDFTPSLDPTPNFPVAFWLAMHDQNPASILYLARPGQYLASGNVAVKYWTNARFSLDVVLALSQIISQVKAELGPKKIILVGFSGGGALAALIASKRQDVSYLATVGGNLNLGCWVKKHNLSALSQSLDPLSMASSLASLPQRHVLGLEDKIIPRECLEEFCRYIAPENLELIIVSNLGHISTWHKIWNYNYNQKD